MALTNPQLARYARHISLPEVGRAGQEKLLAARVLVIGAGGLGSPCLLYLAAAGVGTIGLFEFDKVEESNLQRQIVHSSETVGQPKLASARRRLEGISPDVKIIGYEEPFTRANAMQALADYDILIDGSDTFATRYLTNDACVLMKKPNIYGSVYGFEGQASVFWPAGPQGGPCYRCLFPEPPPPGSVPSCAEGGVLGVLPGLIGTIQATEAIKIILGTGDSLAGRLLLYDALAMSFRSIKLRRSADCPVCGDAPTIHELQDYEIFCGTATTEMDMNEMTADELKARMDQGKDVVLIDVRNLDEFEAGSIPGAKLIPLPELANRLAELEPYRNREIVLQCQVGGRSARACTVLKEAGFENPVNLKGGYKAWKEAGG